MSFDRSLIDAALARRLVDAQFPQWAALPIRPVELDGWDNRTFRLGEELSLRLPTGDWYAQQVAKEQRWLPLLAPQLPLPIPVPVAQGSPDGEYPYAWSVYRWLEGSPAATSPWNHTGSRSHEVDIASSQTRRTVSRAISSASASTASSASAS